MSQLCGMSLSAFKTAFKQYTGQTFIAFRNDIRMQVGKKLVGQTDEKVFSIAQMVGFSDLSFFNKLFKQHVGMSPGDYRKKIRDSA